MKFGLMSANLMGNVEGAAVGELARAAEEVGFHSIWAVEHAVVPLEYASTYPYDDGGRLFKGASQLDISDPLIWLAFAAAVTTKIRLATGIFVFSGQKQKLNTMENSLILLLCIANPNQPKVQYRYL